MPSFKSTLLWQLSFAMLVPVIAPVVNAQPVTARQQMIEPNLLLLEVRLDQRVLSDAVTAYQYGNDIFLPLSELSRLLTIAIRAQPEQGSAAGYVLSEDRGFSLNLAQSSVTVGDRTEALDPALVRVQADDIYVASRLIARWLPLDLDIDLSSLSLRVRPRERLPLQSRLERQDRGKQAGSRAGYVDPGFPRDDSPVQMLGVPFIDQTLGVDVRHGNGSAQVNAAYTAYLTGDLLGMESSLFVSSSKRNPSPDLRFTLGRHDPDAGLLGPLHARTFELGSVPVPGVANIALTSATGNGLTLSNRPLSQPTSFDRHSLQGNLPPGWDVELYFNDALVGFQQSRPDGKYNFDDLPLIYGPNEFRLVFHGPLGQSRVERQSFSLEQSVTAPGEFYYNITEHRDKAGRARSVAQFDVGLNRYLSATGGLVRLPVAGTEQRYANLGLRTFWRSFIISSDLARSQNGGSLSEMTLRTRVGGMSIGVSRAYLHDFTSDLFLPSGDPVRTRDKIRIDGAIPLDFLPRLPLTLEAKRDRLQSGADNIELAGRVSTYQYGIAMSNSLRWQSLGGAKSANGAFQFSRRIAGIGLSGQVNYTLKPETRLATMALSADKSLAAGYLLNLGVARLFSNAEMLYAAALNKSLGSYGWGVSASYSSRGTVAAGVQLFMAMGKEPRQSAWLFDAQPMAGAGAASMRVFVDKNLDGVMDAGDEPIKGVSFTINGGTHQARTDEAGIAYLSRLPVKQNVDIAVDTGSLEDPQWMTQKKGVRVVPRPGKVTELDFPVIMTGEIDGTVYLVENDVKRGVGDVSLELVDAGRKVIAQTRTASDGYYIVPAVPPGNYLLRISREQLKRLNLTDTGMHMITVSSDGTFINGVDFSLIPSW
ncbi:MAG: hypothetical protein JWQ23_1 [Herminiimonas sp.]|nr:hypothetical protein [Herminiimonas sp.]